jgi:hypothetical protein
MKPLHQIFESGRAADAIIKDLRMKSIVVPSWAELVKDYDPKQHKIVTDTNSRKDKTVDGHLEKASRIYIGLEKLLCNRINEFTFGIPPKRTYSNIGDNETRKAIAKAIEAIYKNAHIDSENKKRGLAYYASCEFFTIWYSVKKPNSLYGFDSQYKLKCFTYSPMDGVILWPLFDERNDLIAMSFEYVKNMEGKPHKFFECYTAEHRYRWESGDGESWTEISEPENLIIGKIPGAYLNRDLPVYDGLSVLREEIEYTLSRNSDIIAYNAAPVLKVVGELQGDEAKGETRRRYRVESGGDVAYVSWDQSIESMKYHIENLVDLFFMQCQMPNISFERMVGLGSIGYDARQTVFMDAHLKIGDESGPWLEFLNRECNVIKAFLKQMKTEWAEEIDNVVVTHIITPFNQNDTKTDIDNMVKANGGKALISQKESIERAGLTDNVEETWKLLQEEASLDAKAEIERLNAATTVSAI